MIINNLIKPNFVINIIVSEIIPQRIAQEFHHLLCVCMCPNMWIHPTGFHKQKRIPHPKI